MHDNKNRLQAPANLVGREQIKLPSQKNQLCNYETYSVINAVWKDNTSLLMFLLVTSGFFISLSGSTL